MSESIKLHKNMDAASSVYLSNHHSSGLKWKVDLTPEEKMKSSIDRIRELCK